MTGASAVEAAFLAACRAEIEAPKPGNVHRFASGHGMSAETFERAALAAAPPLAAPGTRLGARVLGAVRASVEATGLNANLGIVLLCAPLAMAAEGGAGDLKAGVRAVLAGLDPEDARAVFAAIALASPGGLGTVPEADVRAAPTLPLVEAMRLASGRDLVARQYAEGFADVFDVGLPAALPPQPGPEPWWPATRAFLAFAARFPDSHVGRKFGAEAAESLRRRFEATAEDVRQAPAGAALARLLALDTALKAEGLNPGTSADLTVAALFALEQGKAGHPPLRNAGTDG